MKCHVCVYVKWATHSLCHHPIKTMPLLLSAAAGPEGNLAWCSVTDQKSKRQDGEQSSKNPTHPLLTVMVTARTVLQLSWLVPIPQ